MTDEAVAGIRSLVRMRLRAGFTPRDEMLDGLDEFVDGVEPSELEAAAKRILAEERAALEAEERSWPAETDCDRLDHAFAELEARGILARQNYTCCPTCGNAEIWAELEAASDAGRDVRGYTYYHEQDTESAVDGHGITLAYGGAEGTEAATVAIGHEVVRALRRHGLEAAWPGLASKRITLALDWKRRRPR